MKRTKIAVAMLLMSTALYSQSIVGVMADGKEYMPNDTLLDRSSCTFHLTDGRDAEWTIAFEAKFGYGEPRVVAQGCGKEICLTVTPELMLKYTGDWDELWKYTNGTSTYFQGYVQAKTGPATIDSIPVMMRVFPRKPKIIRAEVTYDSFDENCSTGIGGWFLNPYISADIQVYDAQYVNWVSFVSDGVFPDFGTHPNCIISFSNFNGDGTVSVEKTEWYVDQCFYAAVGNTYGWTYSDTVFTNSYIEKDILDYINAYYENEASSVNAQENDGCMDGAGNIRLDAGETVTGTRLTDISGRVIPLSSRGKKKSPSDRRIGIMTVKTNKRTIKRKMYL